jgi:hypothetical protein
LTSSPLCLPDQRATIGVLGKARGSTKRLPGYRDFRVLARALRHCEQVCRTFLPQLLPNISGTRLFRHQTTSGSPSHRAGVYCTSTFMLILATCVASANVYSLGHGVLGLDARRSLTARAKECYGPRERATKRMWQNTCTKKEQCERMIHWLRK